MCNYVQPSNKVEFQFSGTARPVQINERDRKVASFSVSVSSDFHSDRYAIFSESVSTERFSGHSLYLLITFKYI